MRNSLIIGVVALLLGLGLGIGGMTVLDGGSKTSLNGLALKSEDGAKSGNATANKQEPAEATKTNERKPREPREDHAKPAPDTAKPAPVIDEPINVSGVALSLEEMGLTKANGVILGSVRGPDGKAISGATVQARPRITKRSTSGGKDFDDGSAPELAPEIKTEIDSYVLAQREYARSVKTDSDGNFEISELLDTNYTITAYHKGFRAMPHGSNNAKAGGRVDFSLEPIRSIQVEIKMPDGSEPSSATVTVSNSNNGYNGGYDRMMMESSFISYSGSYGNYAGNRGGTNYEWSPDSKEITLAEGIWVLSANKDDHEFVSERINVDALSEGEIASITLHLKARNGLKITLDAKDGDVPLHSYYVHARQVSLGNVDIKEFSTKGKYMNGDGSGVFTLSELEPDTYIVSVVLNSKVVVSSQVTLKDEGKFEDTISVPGPDRGDYVAVTIAGVKPYVLSRVNFIIGYRLNNNDVSTSANFVIRRNDGTIWVPHYSNVGKETPNGAEHFVEANLPGVGKSRRPYIMSSGSAVDLSFEEPGILKVQFDGFDPDVAAYKTVSVLLTEEKSGDNDKSKSAKNYYRGWNGGQNSAGSVGQVDDNGVLYVSGITPGRYNLEVKFAGTYQALTTEKQAITITSGMNRANAKMPAIFEVVVEFPQGSTDANQNYVYLYANNQYLSYKYLGSDMVANFGRFPAGDYRVQTPKGKFMDFTLASDGKLYFSPQN